jgi:hypothetical protein
MKRRGKEETEKVGGIEVEFVDMMPAEATAELVPKER